MKVWIILEYGDIVGVYRSKEAAEECIEQHTAILKENGLDTPNYRIVEREME